jgi:hypothetical protein
MDSTETIADRQSGGRGAPNARSAEHRLGFAPAVVLDEDERDSASAAAAMAVSWPLGNAACKVRFADLSRDWQLPPECYYG